MGRCRILILENSRANHAHPRSIVFGTTPVQWLEPFVCIAGLRRHGGNGAEAQSRIRCKILFPLGLVHFVLNAFPTRPLRKHACMHCVSPPHLFNLYTDADKYVCFHFLAGVQVFSLHIKTFVFAFPDICAYVLCICHNICPTYVFAFALACSTFVAVYMVQVPEMCFDWIAFAPLATSILPHYGATNANKCRKICIHKRTHLQQQMRT